MIMIRRGLENSDIGKHTTYPTYDNRTHRKFFTGPKEVEFQL